MESTFWSYISAHSSGEVRSAGSLSPNPGVVDEDVDPAPRRRRRVGHALGIGVPRRSPSTTTALPPVASICWRTWVALLRPARGSPQGRLRQRRALADCLTDAAAAPRDQSPLVLQFKIHVALPVSETNLSADQRRANDRGATFAIWPSTYRVSAFKVNRFQPASRHHGSIVGTKWYPGARPNGVSVEACPLHFLFALLGDKWTLAVLYLLAVGPSLRRAATSASWHLQENVLTQTLRSMSRWTSANVTVYPVVPPKTEYKLPSWERDSPNRWPLGICAENHRDALANHSRSEGKQR